MKKSSRIFALFLPAVFALTLLHQFIPHLHHEHQEEHEHELAKHSHSHEHHHKKESEEPKDFLSILLALHSHSGNSSEVPLERHSMEQFELQESKAEKDLILTIFGFTENCTRIKGERFRNYQPPLFYQNTFYSAYSLRGPPALG